MCESRRASLSGYSYCTEELSITKYGGDALLQRGGKACDAFSFKCSYCEFREVESCPSFLPLFPPSNFLPAGSISVEIDGHCSSPESINVEVRRVHFACLPLHFIHELLL